jgi:hypothetical protein
MGIKEVAEINDGWIEELKNDKGYYEFLMYEPFTDQYWQERTKIVFCNINAYCVKDYDVFSKGDYILSWKIFEHISVQNKY